MHSIANTQSNCRLKVQVVVTELFAPAIASLRAAVVIRRALYEHADDCGKTSNRGAVATSGAMASN